MQQVTAVAEISAGVVINITTVATAVLKAH